MEKKTIKKKLISVSTAIAVMLNLPFAMDLTVKAAGHEHKVCKNSTEGSHECSEHSGIGETWQAWNQSTSLPTAAGNYYLTNSVTISTAQQITNGGTISLCLNGQSVTLESTQKTSIYDVSDGTLNLCNCNGDGKLIGHSSNEKSLVTIGRDSVFNMYSGTISGNTAADGGAVYVKYDGAFNMYGGTISNNEASGSGTGGGVYIDGGGTFTMSNNSMISGNSSEVIGGGVCAYDGSTFSMSNSEIKDCTASDGGGVFVSANATLELNGKVTINNNSTGGNVYLNSLSSKIKIGDDFNCDNTNGSKVKIASNKTPTCVPVQISEETTKTNVLNAFSLDSTQKNKDNYIIALVDNKIVLQLKKFAHGYLYSYKSENADENYHWTECRDCHAKELEKEAHTWGEEPQNNQTCTACGYVKTTGGGDQGGGNQGDDQPTNPPAGGDNPPSDNNGDSDNQSSSNTPTDSTSEETPSESTPRSNRSYRRV